MTPQKRKELQQDILDEIDGWDLDTMIGYCKDTMELHLKQMSNKELLEEWQWHFGDKPQQ